MMAQSDVLFDNDLDLAEDNNEWKEYTLVDGRVQ